MVPVIRTSCLSQRSSEMTPSGIVSGIRTFSQGLKGSVKLEAEVQYLRWRWSALALLGRSLRRDLHMRVSVEALSRVGLLRAEAYYMSLPPCELPPCETRLGTSLDQIPDGWIRTEIPRSRAKSRRAYSEQEEFLSILTDNAWEKAVVSSKVLIKLTWSRAVGTGKVECWRWFSRHMRNMSRLQRRHKIIFRLDLDAVRDWRPSKRRKKVWVRVGSDALRSGPIKFVGGEGIAGCGQ